MTLMARETPFLNRAWLPCALIYTLHLLELELCEMRAVLRTSMSTVGSVAFERPVPYCVHRGVPGATLAVSDRPQAAVLLPGMRQTEISSSCGGVACRILIEKSVEDD
eukprot:COSAG02_NODE_3063_length_7441_cov_56.123944_4_plen_108_part_00